MILNISLNRGDRWSVNTAWVGGEINIGGASFSKHRHRWSGSKRKAGNNSGMDAVAVANVAVVGRVLVLVAELKLNRCAASV